MLKLFYSNVKNLNLSKGYEKVSDSRKNKINNFKFEKDKKLSCGSELLLSKALKDLGISNPIFKRNKYNKPFITNYQNIYFNISHSKDIVICGISDEEIGVDIEILDENIDLKIAQLFFFNSEYNSIMKSTNPKEEFFKYWVLKESYLKYTGLGLNMDLDSFEIKINKDNNENTSTFNFNINFKRKYNNNNNKNTNNINNFNQIKDIKFSLVDFNQYKIAICSKYKLKEIEEVKVEELIE